MIHILSDETDMPTLKWPQEQAVTNPAAHRFSHSQSNICLDFHGNPGAELRVFSDGNHHMALQEALAQFAATEGLTELFYLTLPPPAILPLLRQPEIEIGNLRLNLAAHVLISPPVMLDQAVASGCLPLHRPFMRSQGSVLLVRKGNPHGIRDVATLIGSRLRLFLPHPSNEAAAYRVYTDTLRDFARSAGTDWDFAQPTESMPQIVNGERIHHREAPLALAENRADVTLVYYHLALRYQRIFPEWFDIVDVPRTAENRISDFHVGACRDAGEWGERLVTFLQSETVTAIYRHHGLVRP